jgi:hypothetical protein
MKKSYKETDETAPQQESQKEEVIWPQRDEVDPEVIWPQRDEVRSEAEKPVTEDPEEDLQAQDPEKEESEVPADEEIQQEEPDDEDMQQEEPDAEESQPQMTRSESYEPIPRGPIKRPVLPEPSKGNRQETVQETARPQQSTQENVQEAVRQRAQAPVQENPQARRMRSGPQIYGQSGSIPQQQQQMYSQQGMIRRDMQGRSAQALQQGADRYPNGAPRSAAPQGAMGYPGGMQQARPMMDPQGRPMGAQQQNRPMRPGQPQAGRQMVSPAQKARQIADRSRKLLASPLFLVIALLHTVYLAGSIASIFMRQLNYSQLARLIQSMSLPQQVSGYVGSVVNILSKLDAGMIGANLALHIPDLLFCIGLWLVFITASTAKDRMSGIGFGFMKADIIINMIVSCIVMLLILIVMVATVVAAWVSQDTAIIIMTVALLVATIAIVMMVIMYYFSYLATLTTCRANSNVGETYGTVSSYVAVLHIILALFSFVSLLSGIVNGEIAGIITAAGKILWMVLFGIWLLRYKGKMAEFED